LSTGRPKYDPTSKRQQALARSMRKDLTEPERRLWGALRRRIILGSSHFRRQVSIGPFIADFCSLGSRLVVEIDGNQHGDDEALTYDARRTAFMQAQGFRVLRFSNALAMQEIDVVIDTIAAVLSCAANVEDVSDPHP